MSKYDDIMDLPHHVSSTRKHMSGYDRAAQFSPFAALVGYDAAVAETARLTQERVELTEGEKEVIDQRLRYLRDHIHRQPRAILTYFRPDPLKSGGEYVTVAAQIRRVDPVARVIQTTDRSVIPLEDLYGVELDGDPG